MTEEGRDLTAKEDTPRYDGDDDVIKELTKSMISDGFVMTQGRTSYWATIIVVKMFNPAEQRGQSGIIFSGVYSTQARAMAAVRGISEDLVRQNKDYFEDIALENTVIETFIDTIPKNEFMPTLKESTTEQIDPEEL